MATLSLAFSGTNVNAGNYAGFSFYFNSEGASETINKPGSLTSIYFEATTGYSTSTTPVYMNIWKKGSEDSTYTYLGSSTNADYCTSVNSTNKSGTWNFTDITLDSTSKYIVIFSETAVSNSWTFTSGLGRIPVYAATADNAHTVYGSDPGNPPTTSQAWAPKMTLTLEGDFMPHTDTHASLKLKIMSTAQLATETIESNTFYVNNDTKQLFLGNKLLAGPKDGTLLNTATGTDSLTIDSSLPSTGHDSINIGINSDAGANAHCVAIGTNAKASASQATAIGKSAKARRSNTIAVGDWADANANKSIAIGSDTATTGEGSIILGNKASNIEACTFKVALNNTTTQATDEASGLYTLLNSSGKIPVGRLSNLQLSDMVNLDPDLSYSKPGNNFTVRGNTVSITNGIATGFAGNDRYLLSLDKVPFTQQFELQIALNIDTIDTSRNQWFLSAPFYNQGRAITWGITKDGHQKLHLANSSDASANWQNQVTGTYTFQNNTNYLLKLVFDGTAFVSSYSTDNGVTWTADITITRSGALPIDNYLILGSCETLVNGWSGSIDLTKTFMKVNNEVVWSYQNASKGSLTITYPHEVLRNIATTDGNLTVFGSTNTSVGSMNIGKGTSAGGYAITYGMYAQSAGNSIALGYNAQSSGNNSCCISYNGQATKNYSIALGARAESTGIGAVQIGRGTNSTAGTLSVGLTTDGSNFNNYQLLDSSGKIPGDRMSLQDISAPTTSTVGSVGQFYIDTTNQDAYICVKADTTTPEYIWKKITA